VTFDAYETADGSPVELLTWTNGSLVFYSSNTVKPYQNGPNLHIPLPYNRNPFSQSKDSDDTNIQMTVPNTFGVVNLYEGELTSNVTGLIIERFHLDDPALEMQTVWRGLVVSIERAEDEVQILLQPVSTGAEITPPHTFSALCNSFLYESPGCNLSRDDFRYIATVGAIDSTGLLITFPGLRVQAATIDGVQGGPTGPLSGAELDIYWQGGYIQTGAGEVRDIVEGNYLGDPDRVRVNIPFRSLEVLDGANVYAGCDLSLATCHKKFNNANQFQGYAYIPEIDPANTELPPGTRTSVTKFAGPQ